jgi:hypothetical protein
VRIQTSVAKKEVGKFLKGHGQSKVTAKQLWYEKRNRLLKMIKGLLPFIFSKRAILKAILEYQVKIYYELKKLNDLGGR